MNSSNFEYINKHSNLIKELYKFCKEQLKFEDSVKLSFIYDNKNHDNPLGKTAFYIPQEKKIKVFIKGRHIKDIMRSMCHEMVHHLQNCRGDLLNHFTKNENYAQTNEHLRKMEEEAYLVGSMMFRDWEDGKKNVK